jgi:hypothetical protein
LLNELITRRKNLENDKELIEVASDGSLLMYHATSLVVPLSPSAQSHDRRKLRTHSSRRQANGPSGSTLEDLSPAAKRLKKDSRGNGNGNGGYDSEQPLGVGKMRKEDSREKVLSVFKVSDEKSLMDVLEIRKAVGVTRTTKTNKRGK